MVLMSETIPYWYFLVATFDLHFYTLCFLLVQLALRNSQFVMNKLVFIKQRSYYATIVHLYFMSFFYSFLFLPHKPFKQIRTERLLQITSPHMGMFLYFQRNCSISIINFTVLNELIALNLRASPSSILSLSSFTNPESLGPCGFSVVM